MWHVARVGVQRSDLEAKEAEIDRSQRLNCSSHTNEKERSVQGGEIITCMEGTSQLRGHSGRAWG